MSTCDPSQSALVPRKKQGLINFKEFVQSICHHSLESGIWPPVSCSPRTSRARTQNCRTCDGASELNYKRNAVLVVFMSVCPRQVPKHPLGLHRVSKHAGQVRWDTFRSETTLVLLRNPMFVPFAVTLELYEDNGEEYGNCYNTIACILGLYII